MTALPEWDTVGRADTDAQLVRAWMTGDRDAFGQMYDRYADRLHDFCVGMLGDLDGAADCVQDTFCIAASRLPQLRDPDKLRPWLYSIARNEALHRLRDRRRETPSDELPDEATGDAGPETLAARTELADLISEAADGLSDRDRAVLELSFRHGLGGPELAEALGVTPTYANTIVHRLRETIERSLGALLVARGVRKAGGCPDMASILDGWDGHFNVLIRKRISRHIEGCSVCDERRRELVSPAALLGAAPLFIPAPKALRDNTLSDIRITELRDPAGTGNDDTREPPRKGLFWSAMLLAVLGVAGGLAFVGVHQQQIGVDPAEVSETLPIPSPPKPTATNTPSGGDPSAPGTQSAGPTPTVSQTPTTTTSAPPPSAAAPPVDETPPVFIPVTPPEVTTFEGPEAETPPSPSRDRPSTRTTPTSEVRPPPGITGGPVGSTSPPTRRTSINSIPGSTGSSGGGRAGADDSDSDRSGSTRRGTGRS